MRLFVALWPPPEAADVLATLDRPEHPAVRWTTRDQWHVTLRFLDEVHDDVVPELVATLTAVGVEQPPHRIDVGPGTTRLGRGSLVVPVSGAEALAAAVAAATHGFGTPPDDRPFTGHLTLARSRGRRLVPTPLEGAELTTTWVAEELALVRSHLGAEARYESIAAIPLDG